MLCKSCRAVLFSLRFFFLITFAFISFFVFFSFICFSLNLNNFCPWFVCGKLRAWKTERPNPRVRDRDWMNNAPKTKTFESGKKTMKIFFITFNKRFILESLKRVNKYICETGWLVRLGAGWPKRYALCDCYILNQPSTFKHIFFECIFVIIFFVFLCLCFCASIVDCHCYCYFCIVTVNQLESFDTHQNATIR